MEINLTVNNENSFFLDPEENELLVLQKSDFFFLYVCVHNSHRDI